MKRLGQNGFSTLTIIMILGFLVLMTGSAWQVVRYIDELATSRKLEIEAESQLQTVVGWSCRLTKSRFDQIMKKLTIFGHEISIKPPSFLAEKSMSKETTIVISKLGENQIQTVGTIAIRRDTKRSFRCIVSKRDPVPPSQMPSYIAECSTL